MQNYFRERELELCVNFDKDSTPNMALKKAKMAFKPSKMALLLPEMSCLMLYLTLQAINLAL